jgi:hypothetical protein
MACRMQVRVAKDRAVAFREYRCDSRQTRAVGEIKHIRAKQIIQKIQPFELGAKDAETVFQAISIQEASKDTPGTEGPS